MTRIDSILKKLRDLYEFNRKLKTCVLKKEADKSLKEDAEKFRRAPYLWVGTACGGANAAMPLSGPWPGRLRLRLRQPGHWTAMLLARMGLRPPQAAGQGSTPQRKYRLPAPGAGGAGWIFSARCEWPLADLCWLVHQTDRFQFVKAAAQPSLACPGCQGRGDIKSPPTKNGSFNPWLRKAFFFTGPPHLRKQTATGRADNNSPSVP
jgi:hypothetical protein